MSTPSGTGAESAFFPALHRFDVQAMRHWTAVGRYLGCPLTEVHALMVLGTMGPLAIGQIAKETCMGSAVVTGIVDRLETKGFAKRVNHTMDRRMRVVVLEGPRVNALLEMLALTDQVACDLSEREMGMRVVSIEQWVWRLARCTEELHRLTPLGPRPRRTR